MDNEIWLERWREGRTAWHRDDVNAALVEHLHRVRPRAGGAVLVPLCGMSVDIDWIAGRGHPVVGVELSEIAVAGWFEARGVEPERASAGRFERWSHGLVQFLCGDVFDLDADRLAGVATVYDRAALVALPEPARRRYAALLRRLLPAGARILLLGLEYDPAEMQGPPFSVEPDEVRALFAGSTRCQDLGARDIVDIEPGLAARGLTWVRERVWDIELA